MVVMLPQCACSWVAATCLSFLQHIVPAQVLEPADAPRGGLPHVCAVMRRHNEFTGMARIEELPEGLKVADLFNGAEGVGGLTTMLAVCHFTPRFLTLTLHLPLLLSRVLHLDSATEILTCKDGLQPLRWTEHHASGMLLYHATLWWTILRLPQLSPSLHFL